jgi:GGDEF domain-containing protein
MEPSEIKILARFSQHRFHNFSQAADELLEILAEAVPGVAALARLDPDDGVHRVIGSRGEGVGGLDCGAVLPSAGSGVEADFLRCLGAQAWLSSPLELSDGRIVGVLCAVDGRADSFRPEHEAQLGLVARLLSHEWENVELRSELRRLRGRLSADPSTDADTALPDRQGFLELLGHEWREAERGAVQSVLVACRVGSGTGASGEGATDAKGRLALKLAAETLKATTRDADRVGRIAEMAIGAVLVGCSPQDTPAFLARFLGALERVSEGSRPGIEVSCGVQPLADTSSATEALDLAEAAAGEPERLRPPDRPPQVLG